jgi:hypothetical protein
MAARIGLSSTITILGDCSALIDHSSSGLIMHITRQTGLVVRFQHSNPISAGAFANVRIEGLPANY